MIRFPAVDCALEGFRLTREHPRPVAAWGGLMLISTLVTSAITVGTGLQPALEALQSASQAGDLAAVNAQAAFVGARAPALVAALVIGLAANVVVYTALLRAVLRPEAEGRSFYLRFGRDEARQFGFSAVVLAVLVGAVIVVSIVAGVIAAAIAAVAPAAAPLVRALIMVATVAALIYPVLRLTLAAPMTFDTGKITLRKAWPLGRGQVAGMAGAYALAVVMALLVWLLLLIVVAAVLLAGLTVAGQGMRDLPGWSRIDGTSLATMFSPRSLGALVVQAVVTILVYVITMSPAPAIYRALRDAGVPG